MEAAHRSQNEPKIFCRELLKWGNRRGQDGQIWCLFFRIFTPNVWQGNPCFLVRFWAQPEPPCPPPGSRGAEQHLFPDGQPETSRVLKNLKKTSGPIGWFSKKCGSNPHRSLDESLPRTCTRSTKSTSRPGTRRGGPARSGLGCGSGGPSRETHPASQPLI